MKSNNKLGLCPIVEEKFCTGCSACMNICSKGAITMKENAIGHILPFVSQELCIDCGICSKVCPSIDNSDILNKIDHVYAAWARDVEEHNSSTSGGVSAVIARYIVQSGGVVYGCASLAGGKVEHIRIDSEEDLFKIKGSKYVQSEINFTYKAVKFDLKNRKKVLFTGAPCQVAGLKKFLMKDYENLYTMDLICHGVPSQKLLKDHISYLGFNLNDIDRISFREGGYYLALWEGRKAVYKQDDMHDLFYSGFNDSLFSRESCVNCKYTKIKRTGDITMADFHKLGVDVPFKLNTEGNVSLLTVNTRKGGELFDLVKDRFVIDKRTIEEAIKGNPQLTKPCIRKSDYNKFVRIYSQRGYEYACKRVMWLRLIKNQILSVMYRIKAL